ncbi:hypothetical protein FYK55_03885 [Roseiconus nitratireducens]|uniref:(2Fe-2S) ferredoxin n=1 Tax=Roseiconus nitratireducens TaxID=2605748 RepID=A0A5M6DIK8_9BACT|nr:hypothetical protein [Roseiconus nitratireducens]KAA5546052.1 hypothetical protein FYK55_03885 [Roseiconus nitratireducens]
MSDRLKQARRKADKLGFNDAQYTLVMCVDRKTSKCCSGESMNVAWKHLKQRAKQWRKSGQRSVLRIKSSCIGVCKGGPIIGVLPEGAWYGGCTPEVIDRIFDEHLANGQLVEEHLIASAPIPAN